MKLTAKQKEVIVRLRKGESLSRFIRKTKMVQSIAPYIGNDKISIKTVDCLMEAGLIQNSGQPSVNWIYPERTYELTELGKTIEL